VGWQRLNAKVQALIELQRVDSEILDLTRSGTAHPQRLAELERQIGQAKTLLETEQQKLADNEKQRRDLEQQVTAERDTIKKWEGRLTELRTPREYSALSREIDIAKKTVEGLEEQSRELRGMADPIKRAIDDRQLELMERQEAVGGEAQEIRQKISALRGRLAQLQESRDLATRVVDPALLARYDAIRKKKGIALVPVQSGTCRGCHMSLPPQLFNMLRSGQIDIETCPSCHRLVYAPDPPPEAAG
jgi:predicted  nucleic acid-binding Zn-ribbon protein